MLLLGLAPVVAVAKPDPNFDPSFPFRPSNISYPGVSEDYLTEPKNPAILSLPPNSQGTTLLYGMVGSYYNATARIEIVPDNFTAFVGAADNPTCKRIAGRTFTQEYKAVLGINERGSYNLGDNPVNMYLTLWQPGQNMTEVLHWDDANIQSAAGQVWHLDSSLWQFPTSQNTTSNELDWLLEPTEYPSGGRGAAPEDDIFGLTLAQSNKTTPYDLAGTIQYNQSQTKGPDLEQLIMDFSMDLDNCSTTNETCKFLMALRYILISWPYPLPNVSLQFDSQTANFTLHGSVESRQELPQFSNKPQCQFEGNITVTFAGIIDPYHSDVLVKDSAKPSWLRTVGFNNNSMNIGYSGAPQGRLTPSGWSVASTTLILLFFTLCT